MTRKDKIIDTIFFTWLPYSNKILINLEGINFLFHRDTFDRYSQALVEPIYGIKLALKNLGRFLSPTASRAVLRDKY